MHSTTSIASVYVWLPGVMHKGGLETWHVRRTRPYERKNFRRKASIIYWGIVLVLITKVLLSGSSYSNDDS